MRKSVCGKLWLLIILALMAPVKSFAQGYIGYIVDADTKESLIGATVFVVQMDNGVVAGSDGKFFIDQVEQKELTLHISMVGYKTLIETINPKEEIDRVFYLKEAYMQLDEMVVSVPTAKLGVENIVNVDQKKIKELYSNNPSSLAEAIANMAGVDQISTGSGIGKPVIRGLSGNRIVTYSQGVRLENQQFGQEHGLGENGLGVSGVEVIKGPASLLYGADALGGVVYLVDEKFAHQSVSEGFFKTKFATNTLSSQNSIGFKTNQKGIKWNLFGAYDSYTDYELPDQKRVFNTRFNELSVKSALGYSKNNWVGNIRYSFLKNNFGIPEGDSLVNNINRELEMPYQQIYHHIVSTEHNLYLNKSVLTAVVGFNTNHRMEYEDEHNEPIIIDHMEGEPALYMNLNTLTYSLKNKLDIKNQKMDLISGIQGMYQTNSNKGEEILIPDAITKDIGLYSVLNIDILDKARIEGGLRYDYRDIVTTEYITEDKTVPKLERNFASFNFSLGSMWSKEKLSLRANVASGFRPPTSAELLSDGVHHGALRYEKGNPLLNSEQAFQTDFNVEFEGEHLQLSINPFYNYISDFIYLTPADSIVNDLSLYNYVQGNARLYGGEFDLHYHPHEIHWLHFETNYSRVFTRDENNNPLPLIPANRIGSKLKIEFGQNSKLRLKEVFIGYTYKFQQRRVAVFETSTPSYQLFNIGLDIEQVLVKGSVQFSMGVNNIFNTEYIDHLSRLKQNNILNSGRNIYFSLRWDWNN